MRMGDILKSDVNGPQEETHKVERKKGKEGGYVVKKEASDEKDWMQLRP